MQVASCFGVWYTCIKGAVSGFYRYAAVQKEEHLMNNERIPVDSVEVLEKRINSVRQAQQKFSTYTQEQVDAITFTSDFKKSIAKSWGAFDIIGSLIVVGLCALFYWYFW